MALQHARSLPDPPLELDRALRLTIALGIAEAPAFQSAARRFISRLCTEQTPTMEQVRKTADALDELTRFTLRSQAREALLDLAGQLSRMASRGR